MHHLLFYDLKPKLFFDNKELKFLFHTKTMNIHENTQVSLFCCILLALL